MYTRVFLSAPPGARTQYQYKPTYVPNQPSASAFRPKQPEPKQPQQPSEAQKQQQQQQQQPKQKQNVSFKPGSAEYKPGATTTQRPSESFKPSPTAEGLSTGASAKTAPTTGDYKASPKPERRHPAPEDSSTPPPQETPRRARSRPSFKPRPRRWGWQTAQQEEEKAQTPEPEEAKKEEEDKQDETDNVFTGRFRPRRKIQRRSSCFIKRYVQYACFTIVEGLVNLREGYGSSVYEKSHMGLVISGWTLTCVLHGMIPLVPGAELGREGLDVPLSCLEESNNDSVHCIVKNLLQWI